jgi:acyl-CoA thioester hydrolase
VAHRTTLKVRFNELDPYNHVNHSTYVTYFEVARTEALAGVGLALEDLLAAGHQIVVVDLSVRFRLPAAASDVLTVETWVTELGGASSTWQQRIVREEADGSRSELATAQVRGGFTDTAGRPRRLPPEVRAKLQLLSEPA